MFNKLKRKKSPPKIAPVQTSRLFFARHVKQMLRRLVFANDTQPGLTSSAPTGSAGMSGISLIAAMMQSENMHI